MIHNIPVAIVAAMSKNTRVIGQNNNLLWHIPVDMKRFKALTLGKPVIMGRKTFESIMAILGKPLPNRTNIVVTRDNKYTVPDGVHITHSLEEAFATAATENPAEIHIGGGAELYRQALPYVDRLFLTIVHDDKPGDTFFPDFQSEFGIVNQSEVQTHEGITFEWVDLVRTDK
jgi:dihydrofolate reductase